jgi:mutator protein MutT
MAADVAAGIIRGPDGRVLIAERHRACPGGGSWEFPGGTREEGETLEECLHRELEEELAIRVRIDGLLVTLENPYANVEMTLHAFLCTHLSGEPRRIEVKDWKWVKIEELRAVDLTGADRKILEALEGR